MYIFHLTVNQQRLYTEEMILKCLISGGNFLVRNRNLHYYCKEEEEEKGRRLELNLSRRGCIFYRVRFSDHFKLLANSRMFTHPADTEQAFILSHVSGHLMKSKIHSSVFHLYQLQGSMFMCQSLTQR